jgi:hypothetical protein
MPGAPPIAFSAMSGVLRPMPQTDPIPPIINLLTVSRNVSYLLIKPPKSLTNKDLTVKSLFLKDLGKINR